MLLASFPAGPWQTNCYLIAAGEGADAVVIDPGVGAFEQVAAAAESRGIGVAGVLLTHGHLDHVAGAADVAQRWGVPVDNYRVDADSTVMVPPLRARGSWRPGLEPSSPGLAPVALLTVSIIQRSSAPSGSSTPTASTVPGTA